MNINPRVIYQGHVSLANTKYIKVFGALLVTQLQFGSEVSSWGNLSIKEGSLFGLSHIELSQTIMLLVSLESPR